MLPVERLEKIGYRIAIYPSETQRAAIHAMRNALSTLKREGTTESIDASLTTFKERDRAVDLEGWQKSRKTSWQWMAMDNRRERQERWPLHCRSKRRTACQVRPSWQTTSDGLAAVIGDADGLRCLQRRFRLL